MKKTNRFSLPTFAILLILAVMGIAAWNYFLGDGSLPSMNFMFFSLILFGVILLLVILNLDKIVKLSNPESQVENTHSPIEENKAIEEIVPTALTEEEVQEEIIPAAIAKIEEEEEEKIVPTALVEEKVEEEIVPTPIVAEKPKVEVKKAPVEKPASSSTSKPYGHSGTRRSGVWIDEK
jgi:hypothetical protein